MLEVYLLYGVSEFAMDNYSIPEVIDVYTSKPAAEKECERLSKIPFSDRGSDNSTGLPHSRYFIESRSQEGFDREGRIKEIKRVLGVLQNLKNLEG